MYVWYSLPAVCSESTETLDHSAWAPHWDVLGLKVLLRLTEKTKHVRMKHFLEEAALAWSLI